MYGRKAASHGNESAPSVHHDETRRVRTLGAGIVDLADDHGARLLRDRDDEHRLSQVRRRTLRRGEILFVAAPKRSDDRFGPRRQ
jgi:hypothetical protein